MKHYSIKNYEQHKQLLHRRLLQRGGAAASRRVLQREGASSGQRGG